MTEKDYITLIIQEIRSETPDTKSFILKPSDAEIHYVAGQFLTLVFPARINENRRSYSISSSALLGEPLMITVKRIDNGEFSRYLFDKCRIGDPLYVIGAYGFFTLPDDLERYKHITFFAAGSGIAPTFPLIRNVLSFHPNVSVKLFYSNHSVRDTIFFQTLVDLSAQYSDRFSIDWLFSDSQDLLRARLTKGLVQEHVEGLPEDIRNASLYFMCGPHDYMQMITITLLREGIPRPNLRREIFDTDKPVVKELPPDQTGHMATVRYGGREHKFQTQYPVSILAAAKKLGIILPYSCEAGKCGTCAATCVEGNVWMSYNEVLSDNEVSKGRVLTCTGFAIGGDVVLEFPESN